MKIYFLRHEDRPMGDSTFSTELTVKGKYNAENRLKDLLLNLDIDTIYCSPFIRCQQTIDPFTKAANLTVNVENCLQEIFWDPMFEIKPYAQLNEEQSKLYNINRNYQSILPPNTLKYPEHIDSVEKRVSLFTNSIKEQIKAGNTNKVLICSHMNVINVLINQLCDGCTREYDEYYNMGIVSTMENNTLLYLN